MPLRRYVLSLVIVVNRAKEVSVERITVSARERRDAKLCFDLVNS